jgi:tellurite resistance protein TehA-like permease
LKKTLQQQQEQQQLDSSPAGALLLLHCSAGICMLAVGLALSYHVLGMYYQRLICHNLPPREVIVSSFIPVGAIGMGGWALLNLAGAANTHLPKFLLSFADDTQETECE